MAQFEPVDVGLPRDRVVQREESLLQDPLDGRMGGPHGDLATVEDDGEAMIAARAAILAHIEAPYRRERAAKGAPDLPQLDLDPVRLQSK